VGRYAAALALGLVACPAVPRNPGSGDRPETAAAAAPCQEACKQLASLGCQEALSSADGATCERVCEDAAAGGVGLPSAWTDRTRCPP
jgi:hypothetical protein